MKPTYLQGGLTTAESILVQYRAGEHIHAAPPWETGRIYFDWKWRLRFKGLDTSNQAACEKFIGMRLLPL